MNSVISTDPQVFTIDSEEVELSVGDDIKFKAVTRASFTSAIRKVSGFLVEDGNPIRVTVKKYEGWSDFQVYPHELQERFP